MKGATEQDEVWRQGRVTYRNANGHMRAPWRVVHKNGYERWVELVTPEEFANIALGTVLVSIHGEVVMIGQEHIDQDTRGGFLAYGLPTS